jgi:hypothetical protein
MPNLKQQSQEINDEQEVSGGSDDGDEVEDDSEPDEIELQKA